MKRKHKQDMHKSRLELNWSSLYSILIYQAQGQGWASIMPRTKYMKFIGF